MMLEFLLELLRTHGIWGLSATIAIILVIWLMASLAVQPSRPLRVGFAEYKKTRRFNKHICSGDIIRSNSLAATVAADSVSGTIILPINGSVAGSIFPVEGTVSGRYRNLWMIERVGQMHWPKEPKLTVAGGVWVGQIQEGGNSANGEFEILLLDVPDNVNDRFNQWLVNSHRTGDLTGLTSSDFSGSRILDWKKVRVSD